jgi:hypothetical protein
MQPSWGMRINPNRMGAPIEPQRRMFHAEQQNGRQLACHRPMVGKGSNKPALVVIAKKGLFHVEQWTQKSCSRTIYRNSNPLNGSSGDNSWGFLKKDVPRGTLDLFPRFFPCIESTFSSGSPNGRFVIKYRRFRQKTGHFPRRGPASNFLPLSIRQALSGFFGVAPLCLCPST